MNTKITIQFESPSGQTQVVLNNRVVSAEYAKQTGASTVLRNDSETSLISGAQAHRMLTEGKLPQAGIDRFCVLANDIFALANDEFKGDAVEAARELQTRIGGLQNLRSYTDCIIRSECAGIVKVHLP